MPYARLAQAVRVAAAREAEEERARWLRMAFLAYQVSAPFRKRAVSFAQYLRQVGLAEPAAREAVGMAISEDLAEVKRRALARAAEIRRRDGATR